MYQFIPRATDSQDAVVVSFGQIHGGLNANVIPEEVVLDGTVRTLNRQVRERTLANIHRIAGGIENVTGTKLTVDFYEGTASGRQRSGDHRPCWNGRHANCSVRTT